MIYNGLKKYFLISKQFFILIFCFLFTIFSWAQENDKQESVADSLQSKMNEKGLKVVDSLTINKRPMNPLAPSKAAFYSAVIPGLGQIYNRRYWKAPIVWAALGGTIYGYTFYDKQYRNARTVFKRKRVGLPAEEGSVISIDASNEALERFQNARQNDRDQFLLATIVLYALNIVDANVDAHLKPFNIDDNLGIKMDFQPFLDLNPITSEPNYGMALTFNF